MKNILVVDDDLENRDILRTRLELSGYQVAEASNGVEGVAAAQNNPPDLIILDAMMPKMDGWKVCRTLKSASQTKQIPIIMLTARSQQIEELQGWESGADEYLMKPCDHSTLLEKITAHLSKGIAL